MAKPTSWDRKVCRNSPCMFGHPHMFGCPAYVWMPPCVWTPTHMFGCPLYVLMMFGCPLYIHNTKKACFVRLMGCPYAPNTFGCAPYVWMPTVCLDGHHMFGHPHICLDAPVCLDIPHVWTPQYVWMLPCMFG